MSLSALIVLSLAAPPAGISPVVEVEEAVYEPGDARNGAGPLWCYGSTSIVRIGEQVLASGIEVVKVAPPLNNVRWVLFRREEVGWKQVNADPSGRTREPCPLGAFPDGTLFLSVNPARDPGAAQGSASPRLLQFRAERPADPPRVLDPAWEGSPAFTEHSYRGMGVDGSGREVLLLNILGHEAQHWSFLDRDGGWSARGRIAFPVGDYEKPEPIRLCYPEVALRGRAAHFLAISDIIEPVKAWREYKLVLNKGNTWDYDFRRLFYAWTEDVVRRPFGPALEIASREKTAGHISNLDLWLDGAGRAHLLWLETSADARLREKFFPGVPLVTSLEHCVVEKGRVVRRTTLAAGGEGASPEVPTFGRLHATPEGRLFAIYHCGGSVSEDRLMEVLPEGGHGDPLRVPFRNPFTSFMTASERGGSPPSRTIDLLGIAAGKPGISYARIRL